MDGFDNKRRENLGHASFMVLHEICRAPKGVAAELRLKMLYEWDKRYTHPIKELALASGKAIIEGRNVPIETAMDYLIQISKYKGLYNALAIVYFSCDDIDGHLDDLYDKIINTWETE